MIGTLLETLRALAPVVTPGEWYWANDQLSTPNNPVRQWTISPGVLIADGCNGTPGGDTIDQANARLIVTLRNALPELIAALEVVALVRDEDWLAERISDSLDVDWRPIDAARAIIAALPKETDNAHD